MDINLRKGGREVGLFKGGGGWLEGVSVSNEDGQWVARVATNKRHLLLIS